MFIVQYQDQHFASEDQDLLTKNENRKSFSDEKRKQKSLDNISVFFSFSDIQSPSQL